MIRMSHKHKAIFCHIPKNAGTSIELRLRKWDRVNHVKAGHAAWPNRFLGSGQYIYENLPLNYFIFTVVRNPYERYVSGLNHRKRQEGNIHPFFTHEHLIASQVETLGKLKPSYIMRMENIESDFDVIRRKFDIQGEFPHCNRSGGTELTRDMIDYINMRYDEDFKTFGYEKI